MKMTFRTTVFVLLILGLASCGDPEVKKFKLVIVLNTNLNSNIGDALPESIQQICSYYKDTTGKGVFIPTIYIARNDFSPPKMDSLKVTMSELSKDRWDKNMLPVEDAIIEYDENISKLLVTKIFVEKPTQQLTEFVRPANSFLLPSTSIDISVVDSLKQVISGLLSSNKRSDITIYIGNVERTEPQDTVRVVEKKPRKNFSKPIDEVHSASTAIAPNIEEFKKCIRARIGIFGEKICGTGNQVYIKVSTAQRKLQELLTGLDKQDTTTSEKIIESKIHKADSIIHVFSSTYFELMDNECERIKNLPLPPDPCAKCYIFPATLPILNISPTADGESIRWNNLGTCVTYGITVIHKADNATFSATPNGTSFVVKNLEHKNQNYSILLVATDCRGRKVRACYNNFSIMDNGKIVSGFCDQLRDKFQNTCD